MQNLLRLTALIGALAVAIGAFGAHGLKTLVGPEELATFNTGIRYHFYHVLAMAAACALWSSPLVRKDWLRRAIYCWSIGILLFSGSLYLLTLSDIIGIPSSILGPVTPLGGVFFIVGWALLFLAPGRNLSADA